MVPNCPLRLEKNAIMLFVRRKALQSAAEIRNRANISLADEVPLTRPAQCIRKDAHVLGIHPSATQIQIETGGIRIKRRQSAGDFNPIEMAFSKLKALIRKAAARTYDHLWKAVGHVCELFTDEECYNFFKAAGYQTD